MINGNRSRFRTKIIAFHLPQFHRIPENDRWWGEGFTEWTNTRKAVSLFPGHYQPREPYQDYYYDLTDPSARKWQADLARQYGIYGFCYYHYWFKGKMLLETPVNEIIRTNEPDFPFCLSWANENWTRTWDGLDDHILMKQEYGNEEDWKIHFDYLLEAFKDKRYIRVDNKPVFLIYRPDEIEHCAEMLAYWNQLARKNGLDGIYFVDTVTRDFHNIPGFEASVIFEPGYTMVQSMSDGTIYRMVKPVKFNNTHVIQLFKYDEVWKKIILREISITGKPIYPGAFVDWDNSARRGYNSCIFDGASPDKFAIYLKNLVKKANALRSEFIFVNAWNEWAEGTYLEPDKRHGFAYLEGVKKALEQ